MLIATPEPSAAATQSSSWKPPDDPPRHSSRCEGRPATTPPSSPFAIRISSDPSAVTMEIPPCTVSAKRLPSGDQRGSLPAASSVGAPPSRRAMLDVPGIGVGDRRSVGDHASVSTSMAGSAIPVRPPVAGSTRNKRPRARRSAGGSCDREAWRSSATMPTPAGSTGPDRSSGSVDGVPRDRSRPRGRRPARTAPRRGTSRSCTRASRRRPRRPPPSRRRRGPRR